MKVLLLGAKGMLGEWLADAFGQYEFIGWDRKDLDITAESQVRAKIVDYSPDLVINAAAYTDVDKAEEQKELAFAVNELGVRNIAQAAKDVGATMVHFSTDYVFPGNQQEGYGENDPPGPAVNIYGESKLAGERALKEINPKFYLIRTAWLYGPKKPNSHKNFVDTILRLGSDKITQSADTSQPASLSVVNDQFGSPTYAKDLAEATRKLVTADFSPGIYHLVNSGLTTWYDLACDIFSIIHLPVAVTPVSSIEFPRPAARPKYSVLRNNQGPVLQPWPGALTDYLSKHKLADK